jgi:Carboxypeptidase regulatory-like domain
MQTTIQNNYRAGLIRLPWLCSILLAGSALAATSGVEGMVKDPNGRPIGGATVRIEARGGSTWNKTTTTDSNGHYTYNGLTPGTYRLSLVVNSVVKASINDVKTKPGTPTQLNFDLRTGKAAHAAGPAKKAKHFVWMPAQTGTNLGGRWVEVDDNTAAAVNGANHVEKVGAGAVNRIQSNSGVVRGGN